MLRSTTRRLGSEELDQFRPFSLMKYSDIAYNKPGMKLRHLMAVVKNRQNASIHSQQLQKRLARKDSSMFSSVPVANRPFWLNEIRGQEIGHRQPARLEILNNKTPWNTTENEVGCSSPLSVGRSIRRLMPANKVHTKDSKPHYEVWYSDEDTLKYGKLWEEYDEDMMSLRCYLKEELLKNPETLQAEQSAEDIRDLFENEENFNKRLAYNNKWNESNKKISDEAKEDILDGIAEREDKYSRINAKFAHSGKLALKNDLKGYLQHQIYSDIHGENKPLATDSEEYDEDYDLENQIDFAVENPMVHNFSVEHTSEIDRRHVPFYSNRDYDYEDSQEMAKFKIEAAAKEEKKLLADKKIGEKSDEDSKKDQDL